MLLDELSNISSNLRQMSDQQLAQFASLHKQDPYMFALAVSESSQRDSIRAAQAKPVSTGTVADREIQKMANPAGAGIAALPAPNLETMHAAVGGIVGAEQDYDMGVGYEGGPVEHFATGNVVADPYANFKSRLDMAVRRGELSQQQAAAILQDATSTQNPNPTLNLSTPGLDPDTQQKLDALGQRVDQTRAAFKAMKPPGLAELKADPSLRDKYEQLRQDRDAAQAEYEKFTASVPALNKPAFAAPSAGRKSVATTPMPYTQSVAKEVAQPDIAAQAQRAEERATPTISAEDKQKMQDAQEAFRGEEYKDQRKLEQQAANLSDKQKDKIEDAARKVIPNADNFNPEDLILMGLMMMKSKERTFMGALGEAGAGVIAEKRAQRKEAREDIYRKALTRKAQAEAGYLESGKGAGARTLKDIMSAAAKDNQIAQKLAANAWRDMGERQKLIKQGFASEKDYYDYVAKQYRLKNLANVVKNPYAVGDEDEDEES